jgi:hypothetical protein
VISVCISASFFCTADWRRADGRTACDRARIGGRVPAELGRADGAPGDAGARHVRQPKGPAKPFTFGNGFSSGTTTSQASPVIEAPN